MTLAQAWLLVGVPVLCATLALFTARSAALSSLGVLIAIGGAAVMAPIDRASGAVLGAAAVLLYAAGSAGRGAVQGDDPVRSGHGGDTSPT